MVSKCTIKKVICLFLSITLVFSSIIISDYNVAAKNKNRQRFTYITTEKKKTVKYQITFDVVKTRVKKRIVRGVMCTLKKTGVSTKYMYMTCPKITKCKNYYQVMKKCHVDEKLINIYNKMVEDVEYSALIYKMAKRKFYYQKKKIKGRTKRVKVPIDDWDRATDLSNMIVYGNVSTIIQKYFKENTPSATKIAMKKFTKELSPYFGPMIELFDAFNSVNALRKGYISLVKSFDEAEKKIFKSCYVFSNNLNNNKQRMKKAKERLNKNKYVAKFYKEFMKGKK